MMKNSIIYTLILISVLFAACSEEADFSVNPSLKLEFSCDTLFFDTLFTEVGSPTGVMKVYNRNNSSLRISNVSLNNGETSGFRVNVDGQYSSNIQDLEIRKDDSLYVFVEATLHGNSAETPLPVTDSLVFTLESGVRQYITLLAYGRDVHFLHAPVYTSDTRIPAGHYLVYDSLIVAENATLTIDPGATLYFHKDTEVKISGTLQATGTREQPIVFRGNRIDNMFDYLPYDRIPGQWGGITFDSASIGNRLEYCDIHSAEYGIKVVEGDTASQRLTIQTSRIENFDGNALETTMARVDVANSLIANARGNCVKIVGGRVRFIHCTIANFYVWKQRDVALSLHNSIEGRPAPLREALFANCIIEGSREDELMGYFAAPGDTVPNCANYRFVNSLVNTVNEENANFVNVIYDEADKSPFGKEHFHLIDNDEFKYDFHLSDSAAARGIASPEYTHSYRFDLDGIERPDTLADAGCYQYVKIDKEESRRKTKPYSY